MDWIVEFVVGDLHARARLDMSEPCGAVRLAIAILGSRCIRFVSPRAIPGDAALAWGPRGAAMYIRAGLSPRQVNQAVAHELAEWKLRLSGYAGADIEELACRIAAALCVPRLAFERARLRLGDSIQALSRCFGVSQPLMASRIAECSRPSIALAGQLQLEAPFISGNCNQPGMAKTRGAEQLRCPNVNESGDDLIEIPQAIEACSGDTQHVRRVGGLWSRAPHCC